MVGKIASGAQMRCHLRILNGIHADASCELRDTPLVVGSDRDVDIALLDDGLAGRHVSFRRLDSGTLQIAALAEGVTVDGVALEPAQERELSRPAHVTIGAVAFELVYEKQQVALEQNSPSPRPSGKRLSVSRIVGVVGIVLAFLAMRMIIWPIHGVKSVQTQLTIDAPKPPVATISDKRLATSVVEVFHKLGVSGLTVEARAGVVGVSGNIDSAQWGALEKAEQWFDRSYGQRYVLISSVKEISKVSLKIPIQSVWDGKNPSIVVKGQRYILGSDVMSGYRLLSVSGGNIIILHDGDRIVIPY